MKNVKSVTAGPLKNNVKLRNLIFLKEALE